MIPFAIPAFFGTLAGKIAFWGGVSALALGVYGCEVHKQRNVGVQKERARVEKQGEKIGAKAAQARRSAERAVPDSLRKYQRD
jgi:uncharacterized protein HemX